MSRHDSHFLLLLDLLLFLLVVLHYLQPLSLDQTALLDVELFLRLQEEMHFTQMKQKSSVTAAFWIFALALLQLRFQMASRPASLLLKGLRVKIERLHPEIVLSHCMSFKILTQVGLTVVLKLLYINYTY